MADITLGDGREITFDLNKITIAEYEELLSGKTNLKREQEILEKVSGLMQEEIRNLSVLEYKKFATAFIGRAMMPVSNDADPKN